MPLTASWLPGHGPRPIVDGDFDAAVCTLAQALTTPTVVVGYSLGARLALALTLRFPERVSKAILIGGTPGLEDEATRARRRAWDDGQARQIEADIHGWAEQWATLPIFASQTTLPDATRAEQQAVRRAHDPVKLAWAMRQLGQGRMPNMWPDIERLRRPVTFVAGANDAKYVNIAKRAATLSSHAQLKLIEDCGHNPLLERAQAVDRLVKAAID